MANALAAVISVTRFYYVRIAFESGKHAPSWLIRRNLVKSAVQIMDSHASRSPGTVAPCPITAHDVHAMMHYGAYGDRCAVSSVFQSATLLLPVESKLLGSFMRLIPPGARDRESHASQPRRVFVLSHFFPVFFPPSFSRFPSSRNRDNAGELFHRALQRDVRFKCE